MPMIKIWLWSIASVVIVSLISLIGLSTFGIKTETLKKFLIYMLAFSAGALFGDAFIHLIPGIVKKQGSFGLFPSISLLSGIVLFFIVEKFIHWQHCHIPVSKEHIHPFTYMNLVGDGVHNFIDGLIIAGSYLVNLQIGIATTLAVVFHEIPKEMGVFGVLVHGGFSRGKALALNFLTALIAVSGTIIALLIGSEVADITTSILLPIAAGGFIYIAGADLIPELHKETASHSSPQVAASLLQLLAFVSGIGVMALLLLLE